jgi:hypothetical protein
MDCATVDTGSDLDPVSPAYAKSRTYNIKPAFEQVEFSEYSVGCTNGVINITFVVGSINSLGFHSCREPINLDLFAVDNINADKHTIDTLGFLSLQNTSLIPSIPRLGESDLNSIRHLRGSELGIARLWKKAKRNSDNNMSGSCGKPPKRESL